MKKVALIIFIFSFVLGFSQKKKVYKDYHFHVKYLLKNSKDTIKGRIVNFDLVPNVFSYYTIVDKFVVFNEKDEKKILKENDVQYLEVTDLIGERKKFVSSKIVSTKELGLIEIFTTGKIEHYSDYKINRIFNVPGIEIIVNDYVVDHSINKVYGPFKHPLGSYSLVNLTKDIKEKFQDDPDLMLMLENLKNKEDYINLLNAYNNK